jgi:hypothetical protein
MAQGYKCDKCGKFCTVAVQLQKALRYREFVPYCDLCTTCSASLHEFLRNHKETKNGTPTA